MDEALDEVDEVRFPKVFDVLQHYRLMIKPLILQMAQGKTLCSNRTPFIPKAWAQICPRERVTAYIRVMYQEVRN